jgi:PAS domain S-box-containing protein
MLEFFRALFGTDFMPHLYCLRGDPGVLWLQVLSDLAIAVAYYAIPLVLLQVVLRRKEILFRRLAVLFVLFIAACGTTHLLAIWTIWYPMYRLEGVAKALTAILSLITAVVLVRLRSKLMQLPSVAQLEKEITERKRAEDLAHSEAERFRTFGESVQDYAIYLIDTQGRVETWNPGAERIKGYSAEEIIGRHYSCFYTPEDVLAGKPEETLRSVVETGRHEGEGWRVRKDGTRFWANVILRPVRDSTGALRGFSKVTRDLTNARATESKYQALLEATPDAIIIVNHQGRIMYANRRMEELFGYPRAELNGESVDMLVPVRFRGEHEGHRHGFFRSPTVREVGTVRELWGLRKDGSEFSVEISLSPLEGADGTSVTAAIRDITERKLASRQLAEKLAELRHSNEALEQFAHIASHDLQEPLRMVASYTQLLGKRYKGRLDADADEFIGYAVDGTQRMKRLIEDLLLYSRAGKGGPPQHEFSSEDALREVLTNLRGRIEESAAEITYDPLPMLLSVESQFIQILQNLIVNAIKYRGNRVPQVHISATVLCQEWVFSVRDNGIGIESQYFERIFQVFQRLHGRREYEGTGIGLAICQRILQQQGGRIWVESEPGSGSVFHFSLPMR